MIVPYKFPLVMGNEFVGVIEKLGAGVKRFSIGDRVYGRMPLNKIGAFAEYAAVDQKAIAKVPEYLSDEEAACVPLTALTALQAFELMKPGAGLERISEVFSERQIEASVDERFSLDDVNKALQKVAAGKSKGKTIIQISLGTV